MGQVVRPVVSTKHDNICTEYISEVYRHSFSHHQPLYTESVTQNGVTY